MDRTIVYTLALIFELTSLSSSAIGTFALFTANDTLSSQSSAASAFVYGWLIFAAIFQLVTIGYLLMNNAWWHEGLLLEMAGTSIGCILLVAILHAVYYFADHNELVSLHMVST